MMKLSQFQPELVTKAFPEVDLKADPAKINRGLCMRWAYMAFHMFEGVELWDYGSHAFIRYQGKFYDSERLQGVEDWKDLPACNFGYGCGCSKCKREAVQVDVSTFEEIWIHNVIKPNWVWYRELAAQGLK